VGIRVLQSSPNSTNPFIAFLCFNLLDELFNQSSLTKGQMQSVKETMPLGLGH
jgi:hypothetical protein